MVANSESTLMNTVGFNHIQLVEGNEMVSVLILKSEGNPNLGLEGTSKSKLNEGVYVSMGLKGLFWS